MVDLLRTRRENADDRLSRLKTKLSRAQELVGERACVYVTGSFGRGEASEHSDLDLFIVGRVEDRKPSLSRLAEILVKAELIEKTRKLGFPDFSGDGEYLNHHTVDALVKTLGAPADDVENTFTARLLLLLESRPLLGESTYQHAIDAVITAYWRDYDDHKSDFVPAFLANDVLRLWRTFCVNYEARTEVVPPEKKSKRKLKNYKLKHSRLVTCYSALCHLLAVLGERGTVSPDDVREMVGLRPTERLKRIPEWKHLDGTRAPVEKILDLYERFLVETDAPEDELVVRFLDKDRSRHYTQNASDLGDSMYELLDAMRGTNKLFRLLIV